MSKGKKTFVIILVLAAVGVGGYFIYRRFKGSDDAAGSENDDTGQAVSGSSVRDYLTVPCGYPLKKGSKGKQVADIQRALNKVKGKTWKVLTVDGIWGDKTDAALKGYCNAAKGTNYTTSTNLQFKAEENYSAFLSTITKYYTNSIPTASTTSAASAVGQSYLGIGII